MKAWIPATLVAVVLAIGIGAAAYITVGHGASGSPSPSPTLDLHSDAAVIAAIKHYYDVENQSRRTGDIGPMAGVTAGPGTPAYENFKAFLQEQASEGRHSVSLSDQFSHWSVTRATSQATVLYTLIQRGHDTDATTGAAVESDMSTPPTHYRATLHLDSAGWRIYQRDLLGHD
ncbi:MAG TPA: hypothetical protein VNV65_10965 [Candidatus Solibacter sp.]|nr:hypothetical protein [Candidatus Solibacter sp.]